MALVPDGDSITPDYLSERLTSQNSVRIHVPTEAPSLKQVLLTFEREYVAEVLRQNHGNAVRTAKILGVCRQMQQKRIKAYNLCAG